MDIQLKRGLLDICVLAAIKSEDSYGYKIIKDLDNSGVCHSNRRCCHFHGSFGNG